MKAYNSIEELAKDLQVSERTGWRWLSKGTVVKTEDGDGKEAFSLFADNSPDGSSDKGGNRKPISTVTLLEDEKLLQLNDPLVREKRREVAIKVLDTRGLEADNLYEELSQKKAEKTLVRDRLQKIQVVKQTVIPSGLREQLPPDILLMSLRLVDECLKDADYTLDECIALAKSIVWMKYWGANKDVYRIVGPSIVRWMFSTLDENLHADYGEAVRKGFDGTYDDFMAYVFSTMSLDGQIKVLSFIHGR